MKIVMVPRPMQSMVACELDGLTLKGEGGVCRAPEIRQGTKVMTGGGIVSQSIDKTQHNYDMKTKRKETTS